jgi:hypothetical protein
MVKKEDIAAYWRYANVPEHPGCQQQSNIVGLYGDDCRYNAVGEKLIAIAMNIVLHHCKRFSVETKFHPKIWILWGSRLKLPNCICLELICLFGFFKL